MIDYECLYLDKTGEKQTCVITAVNARTAMNNLFELYKDAKQIISCMAKPMFED